MMSMFHRLRRRLALISYYSASRRRTAWTRAADLALVVALLIALPVAWIADHAVVQRDSDTDVHGRIAREHDGSFTAWIIDADRRLEPWGVGVNPYAEFQFTDAVISRGWPYVTTKQWRKPSLDLHVLAQGLRQKNVQLDPDDPLRAAIETAMSDQPHRAVVEAWLGGEPQVRRRWHVWIVNSLLWWMMLTFAAWMMIGASQFAYEVARKKRMALRRERVGVGICPECGYDLRGNLFSERCPECGAPV